MEPFIPGALFFKLRLRIYNINSVIFLFSVKGKRTQKRNLKHGHNDDISKSDLGEAEDKGNSDILNPEPTTTSKADEVNSGEVLISSVSSI